MTERPSSVKLPASRFDESSTPSPVGSPPPSLPPRSASAMSMRRPREDLPSPCFATVPRDWTPVDRGASQIHDLVYDKADDGLKAIGMKSPTVSIARTGRRSVAGSVGTGPGQYNPTTITDGGGAFFSPHVVKAVRNRSASVTPDRSRYHHRLLNDLNSVSNQNSFGSVSGGRLSAATEKEVSSGQYANVDPAVLRVASPVPDFEKMSSHDSKVVKETGGEFRDFVAANAMSAVDRKVTSTSSPPLVTPDFRSMSARQPWKVQESAPKHEFDEGKAYASQHATPPTTFTFNKSAGDRTYNRHEAVQQPMSVSAAYDIRTAEKYMWSSLATPDFKRQLANEEAARVNRAKAEMCKTRIKDAVRVSTKRPVRSASRAQPGRRVQPTNTPDLSRASGRAFSRTTVGNTRAGTADLTYNLPPDLIGSNTVFSHTPPTPSFNKMPGRKML
ncbi:hypothetical protein J8273_3507 [Carpediemonas membranifera]|uniref:Uncharacterized protein n=1 Tax=Carpediemonas membranifera TaxID=201153 RepID=A0A8J6E1R1_9EUKA|nr:hypothetical protein J8273_3507 [Carpediemonas membranifera]|eukprot:KAG9393371.1 hypothetical protein J8273_3507 [Carpediemonas membranifera]